MSTYVYKNFETWVADGKKSGYENFSKEKKLVKNIIRFFKKAWDRVNFFSKLYARIPKELKQKFIASIFTVILFQISTWLVHLIQGWFGNIFIKIFPAKTVPVEILVEEINGTKIVFLELWHFFKPIAQALIINRFNN